MSRPDPVASPTASALRDAEFAAADASRRLEAATRQRTEAVEINNLPMLQRARAAMADARLALDKANARLAELRSPPSPGAAA